MSDVLNVETRMGEVMEALPGSRRALFARYHLGGCQSCAFSNEESLAELCARSELDAEEVLAHLLASHAHDLALWVEPAVLRDWLAAGTALRLVDLRTREEHEAVSLPGAEFFTQDLQQQLFAGDPGARVVLYDHLGRGVLDQVAWFRGHGLGETFGLRGGIDAWSREIDPKLPRYRLEID
jgi:rhodanese-related sulfurtransferase